MAHPHTSQSPANAHKDRGRDSVRIEAFARLLRDVLLRSPVEGGGMAITVTIGHRVDRSGPIAKPLMGKPAISVSIHMPKEVSFKSYESTAPLVDPAWEGTEPRFYSNPEDALRAALDNAVERKGEGPPRLVLTKRRRSTLENDLETVPFSEGER